jgi:putative PIN family toxin of toxin-antitoxin system
VRAVLDTNVLLSGLIWHGPPHTLIEQIRGGSLTLISSPAMIAELADVAARAKFASILAKSSIDPERMVAEVRRLAENPRSAAAASSGQPRSRR